MSDGEGLQAGVEALVERWEREGSERGPADMLYTNGVVGMLRALLADTAPTPDEPGRSEGQARVGTLAQLGQSAEGQAESWSDIAARDGWEDVPEPGLHAAAVNGIAWALLEETMDTSDREPSAETHKAACETAERILAARGLTRDGAA